MWRVEIFDPNNYAVMSELSLSPETLIWGEGGPTKATINVTGDIDLQWEIRNWLGYRVRIYSPLGTLVWWGMVTSAQVGRRHQTLIYSMANMANRVRMAYTIGQDRFTTDWAENSRSVERYGRKETMYSRSDLSAAQAEAERDRLLDDLAWPIPEVRAGGVGSQLRCDGYWATLDWLRYEDETGRQVFEETTETAEQMVGWSLSGSDIGFTKDNNLHSGQGKLTELIDGAILWVTGTANSGQLTVSGSASEQPETYTATTISFDPSDDVMDSADGFGFIESGTLIKITGSSSNDGWYLTKTHKGPDRFEISPGFSRAITGEGAGASVSIQTSQSISIAETLANEVPGTAATITAYGEKLSQSITVEATESWTLAEVVIRVKKVGNPGDYLKIELFADSGGIPGGSALDSGMVVGDELADTMQEVSISLNNTNAMTPATVYYLVVSRTGANDPENFYIVEVDEGTNYAGGSLLVWTGAAWVARSPAADMPFELWGHMETSRQIERIAGAFDVLRNTFGDIDARKATAIVSRQYRDGDRTALAEIRDLVAAGTAGGERLQAMVTAELSLLIDRSPTADEATAIWQANGLITDLYGQVLPPGELPYQEWVRLAEAPTIEQDVAPASPVFFTSVELHVPTGRITPTTPGGLDPWQVGGVRQG